MAMRLQQLAELLDCEVLLGREQLGAVTIRTCFAADLMSDVLRFANSGTLLLTGLASVQAVHTADVADMAAIVFVGAKRPSAPVLELARTKGIPLLSTPHGMFDACGILYRAHLAAADQR